MPAKYRQRLLELCEGKLIITIHPVVADRCLLIYPEPTWEEVEQQLDQLAGIHQRVVNIKRIMIGHAQECEMDRQGRILLSAELRKFAQLNDSVVLVGQTKKFELWDARAWERKREEVLFVSDDSSEMLPELSRIVY